MKRFAYLVVLLFVSCAVVLTGCGWKGYAKNPASTDVVVGNGGMVVQQGQYIYFANGYNTYDNVAKSQVKGGLYRAQLTAESYTNLDDNDYLTNAEKMTDQLVGYDLGGIYMFDGYVYYATPNMEKDKEGNLLHDYIDFYRVKVNGADKKRLYTSNGSMKDGSWGMIKVNNTVYFVVYNGDTLTTVVANGKKATSKTIASGVTSYGYYQDDMYDANNYTTTDATKSIWYTRSATEEEKKTYDGNILAKCEIGTNNEETLFHSNDTYEIVQYTNHKLYVKVTDAKLNTTSFVGYELPSMNVAHTYTLTTSYVLEGETIERVVFDNNGVFELYADGRYAATLEVLTGASVIDVQDTKIIYIKDSVLYSVDALSKEVLTICGDSDLSMNKDAVYDFDGRNVYFMHTYKNDAEQENQYLVRWDTLKSDPVLELIGVFADGHAPAIETEDTEK